MFAVGLVALLTACATRIERAKPAEPTLYGTVSDSLGQPISGARIVIIDAIKKRPGKAIYSDPNGAFESTQDFHSGTAVRVSKPGYSQLGLYATATPFTNRFELKKRFNRKSIGTELFLKGGMADSEAYKYFLLSDSAQEAWGMGFCISNFPQLRDATLNATKDSKTKQAALGVLAMAGRQDELLSYHKAVDAKLDPSLILGGFCQPESEAGWQFIQECLQEKHGVGAFSHACSAMLVSSSPRAFEEIAKAARPGRTDITGECLLTTADFLKRAGAFELPVGIGDKAPSAALRRLYLGESMRITTEDQWVDQRRSLAVYLCRIDSSEHGERYAIAFRREHDKWVVAFLRLLTIS